MGPQRHPLVGREEEPRAHSAARGEHDGKPCAGLVEASLRSCLGERKIGLSRNGRALGRGGEKTSRDFCAHKGSRATSSALGFHAVSDRAVI